jgi:hypothetical protein
MNLHVPKQKGHMPTGSRPVYVTYTCAMDGVTTIKVPKTLRDRIAAQAERDRVPFASVIERALDAADEDAFWERVREQNRTSSSTRDDEGSLRDNLDPTDALPREEW